MSDIEVKEYEDGWYIHLPEVEKRFGPFPTKWRARLAISEFLLQDTSSAEVKVEPEPIEDPFAMLKRKQEEHNAKVRASREPKWRDWPEGLELSLNNFLGQAADGNWYFVKPDTIGLEDTQAFGPFAKKAQAKEAFRRHEPGWIDQLDLSVNDLGPLS